MYRSMYGNNGISTSCGNKGGMLRVKEDGMDMKRPRQKEATESGRVVSLWKQEEEVAIHDDGGATERNNNAAEAHFGILRTDERDVRHHGHHHQQQQQVGTFSADGRLHHLTRHWLAPDERGARAIEILGASDMKTAEALIRNMAQRDLRLAFEQVYESKTKSFNNIWLRRKLFEAIGSNSASNKKKKTKRVAPSAGPSSKNKQNKKTCLPAPVVKERACLQGLLDHRRFDPPILSLTDNTGSRSPFPPGPPAPPLFKQQYEKKVSRASNIDTAALEALAKLASEYVPVSPESVSPRSMPTAQHQQHHGN